MLSMIELRPSSTHARSRIGRAAAVLRRAVGGGAASGPAANSAPVYIPRRQLPPQRSVNVRSPALDGGGLPVAPKRTRIQRAVQRAQAAQAEQQQELMATNVFNSVVMYTPRGHHGSCTDTTHNYPVKPVRYPSLAASAMEATKLNEAADEEARRKRQEWLDYGKKAVDRMAADDSKSMVRREG